MAEENSNSFSIVSLGKPIEKLIDTVGKAVGTLYKPKALRNEADAEAYKIEAIANAKAKAAIIKSDTDNEIAERAKQRLYLQEINRQQNLDNIIEKSVKFLDESVSEIPVDENWRTRFFNKAQDITSEEMQEVWAKILANEINRPGNFSLRTLDIVSNLSKKEAEITNKLAGIRFSPLYILKFQNGSEEFEKFGISYSDLLILREAGILFNQDDLSVKLHHELYDSENDTKGLKISFGEKQYFVLPKNNSLDLYRFPVISFTLSGAQISQVIECKPDYLYLDQFIKYWSDNGYEFKELDSLVNIVKL
jgi:hypothetical protein